MRCDIDRCQSIHGLGNGRIGVFGNGLNYTQLFGPNYSSPNAASLTFLGNREACPSVELDTVREPGTAIWNHTVWDAQSGKRVGKVQDFSDADKPVTFRKMEFQKPQKLVFETKNVERWIPLGEIIGEEGLYYGELPPGLMYYDNYAIRGKHYGLVTNRMLYMGIRFTGDGGAVITDDAHLEYSVRKGILTIFFSDSMDRLMEYARMCNDKEYAKAKKKAERFWQRATASRLQNYMPPDETVAKVCDDTYTLIKTQQSVTGGVLAGTAYHLAYLRDNYGVNRGLLAMGAYAESKKLLEFYWKTFRDNGAVHNAQGTDYFGFHVHENDGSEITGYMMRMFLEYHQTTKDISLLKKALPLLLWCAERQHNLLRHGMLPFNGDETYIAGGLIPREVIHQGSMEATMLYHTALRDLLKLEKELNLKEKQKAWLISDKEEIEKTYAKNFYIGERIVANNDAYYDGGQYPKLAFGVRMCGHGIGINVLDKSKRYVCPDCVNRPEEPNEQIHTKYYLQSPLLMAFINGASLPEEHFIRQEANRLADKVISEDFLHTAGTLVGYDPGLLLLLFAKYRPELTAKVRQFVLDIRDDVGAWYEYYCKGKACCTPYRPWESALNCEAVIRTTK